jgi:outer membrane protein TolC
MDMMIWNSTGGRIAPFGVALVLAVLWTVDPGISSAQTTADDNPAPESEPNQPTEQESTNSSEDEKPLDSERNEPAEQSADDFEGGVSDPGSDTGAEGDEAAAAERSSELDGSSGEASPSGELLPRREALEIALEKNHDVAITETETEIAERNVSLGNAGFLPRLEAVGSQSHLFGGSGLFGQGQFFTRTSLGVQASWLLFAGLGRFSTYDRLKITRSVREIERRARIEETLADVAVAYHDVVRQRELLRAFEETREVSKERLSIARSRLQAGPGSQVDVNLAEVELYRDRSAVADQRIALTQSRTELNRLMGREADREFRVEPEIEVVTGLDYRAARSRALKGNRTLRAARRRRERATETVHERRAERWPEIQLSLGYNYTEFHNGVAPQFDVPAGLEYGVNVAVPIFDGFNIHRRIANARSERVIRSTEVRREETRVRKAVRDAHSEYRRHVERIDYAEKSVELARNNVDVALAELEAGTATQVELRQVQLNLQDARTRLIDAKYKAKRAELRLRRLMGELYDEYVE